MRTYYQLQGQGAYKHLSGSCTIISRLVYATREAAEAATESFKAKCLANTNSTFDMDPVHGCRVVITELTCEEGDA